MSEYFITPGLPDRKVSTAICGRHEKCIIDFIKSYDIDLIFSDDNNLLDNPVSNHIDLNVHHLGGKRIIIDKRQDELYKILLDSGMDVIRTEDYICSPYPKDCALNCFRIGEYLFCNKNITDNLILNEFRDYKIAHINQGYSKCSTLLLDEKTFITDDTTIYNKGKKLSLNCILIDKGDVSLDGYNYGFIGGASAKISNDTVMFFGDITKHRNYLQIEDFINACGMKYIFTKDFPLTDIGGIVPIK